MINITISTNVLIFISCIVLFLIIGFIAFIIYKDEKNDQAEIDELLDDVVKAKPRKETVQVTKIEPADSNSEKMNLEEMLTIMQNDLEKKNEDKIQKFEKDQEENAIISYKELVKAAEEKRSTTENFEKEQEQNAIISLKELNGPKLDLEEPEVNTKDNTIDFLTGKEKRAIAKIESPREMKDKKFKSTEFISPIFGKMNEHLEYPKVRSFNKNDDLSLNSYFGEDVSKYYENKNHSNVMASADLSEQLKKNDEFLKALKEFRSNL